MYSLSPLSLTALMASQVGDGVPAIRVPDVYERDALLGADGGAELVCTRDAVRFDAGEASIRLAHDEVENVRVDVDRSVAGFTRIGNVFGFASLLLAVAVARMVLTPGLPSGAVLGAGVVVAPLSAYAAVWMRRLEVGERRVLQLDSADGGRTVFVTGDAGGKFEAIRARIAPE